MPMLDLTGGKSLKDLFKRDSVRHDDVLFRLHHQINFFVVFFGVVFLTGMNYLNGNSIICLGGNDYITQYCWLHGSGIIPDKLRRQAEVKCMADQAETKSNHTHYYLWVPFVLGLCLALIKAPRFIWKNICERGMLKGIVENPEKIRHRFSDMRKKANMYHRAYFFCEILNIVCVVLCMVILNTLFDGKFLSYGENVFSYDKDVAGSVNPMCNLFPTEVSCTVNTGGINGDVDKTNVLCLLSNNLFNQYYFLILWVWWMFLLTASALGFVFRLAQILSPGFSKITLISIVSPYGQEDQIKCLEVYQQGEYFLLSRICQNLKGSQIKEVLSELVRYGNEESHSLMKHRKESDGENHEMLP